MKTRIGSLISSIVTLIISGVMFYICYSYNPCLEVEGAQALTLFATLPMGIVFYLILFGAIISSITTSSLCLTSSVKGVRITGIILLFVSILFLGFSSYLLVDFIKKLS